MEKPDDDPIAISYEIMDTPVMEMSEKPRYTKAKRHIKVKPNVGAVLRIKTSFEDPLPFFSVTCSDPKASVRVSARDILKGTVTAVVIGDRVCEAVVNILIFDTNPVNEW